MANRHSVLSLPGAFHGRRLLRPTFLPTAVALLFGVSQGGAPLSAAVDFTSIFGFYSGLGGACPNGKVLLVTPANGSPGYIYGTTYYGGTTDNGIVYQLTKGADGTYSEQVIYSFTGGSDGGNPTAGLKMDANGALYGTASTSNGQPIGVVFQLVPPKIAGETWSYNVIHAFGAPGDGANPQSDLIVGTKGALWGTTVAGGTGFGTVYQLAPPVVGGVWGETVIYTFTGGADGAQPYAGLAADLNNNIFGATYTAGTSNAGTVFKLSPPVKGRPSWTETTLYTFKGTTDGLNPLGGVTLNGTGIIGTTYLGGNSGEGVIYQLTPPAVVGDPYVETVLVSFDGANGANPSDAIEPDLKGNFYGSTGGAQAGTAGTVFKLTPGKAANTYNLSTLYTFSGGADGQAALPSISQSLMGAVYGSTFYGGAGGAGSVFRIN